MSKRWVSVLGTATVAFVLGGCGLTVTKAGPDLTVNDPPRSTPNGMVVVSPDNFVRAVTDEQFTRVVNENGFGQFHHWRDFTPIDRQIVVRPNRDTLYSAGVFDLQSSPVTITLPESGKRFVSTQVINQDEYITDTFYGGGQHTLDRKSVGTRYVLVAVRTLANPKDPGDLDAARALQDAMTVQQNDAGTFEVPRWDPVSQRKVNDALIALAETVPDTRGMFGSAQDTDPVRHLIGAASAWGGNSERDALYLNVTPPRNDGTTVYRVTVGNVPVQDFWSISVYNKAGYFAANPQDAYSINSITGSKSDDGSVTVQFGGCTTGVANCLPITPGWNYLVRLYRPEAQILSGAWTFPQAEVVGSGG